VTGRPDGQATLEAIERANLFLVPLDDVRGWWRYHHLFADLLRARLERQQPEQVRELHRKAAGWHERHGLAEDAVRHAMGVGDAVGAARLIERHVDGLLMRSEGATVQRWLAALPVELVGSRPRLLLARARLALLNGQVEGVDALLDTAERAAAAAGDEAYEPSAGRGASLLANVPATIALDRAYLAELSGDAERAITFASQARAEISREEWMLDSHAGGYLALADWMRGRLPEAERALRSSVGRWRAAGERHLAVRGLYHLGQVQRARGHLDEAARTYHDALAVTAPVGPAAPAAGMAYVGLAEVAYQRGELDVAGQYLHDGIAASRQLVYTQPLATGLAALAWIRQAGGDRGGAREAMEEAVEVSAGRGVTNLLDPVPAQRARLLLAHGDLRAAVQWVQERDLRADDEPGYPREPEYLVLARVLLAQGRADRAYALLERLNAMAAAQGRTGSVIEIRALQALAVAARGDADGALAALAEALALACPQGYVRVFADEGPPMEALVGRLVAAPRAERTPDAVPLAYLARLLRAFHGRDAARRGPGAAVPGLVEQLTAREVEVLGLLAAGRSNRRIAAELFVTLDTVKKHVGRVLDKLGATNRTEAVARARDLDLIP
ncbi:MAG TPA: LuxR C-terminal-related transcriptional regulator, partial [Micromonosporaceae bacterium]|nr:LuxR C-terminal-related transcriptional regulator [Micromonosporaceae bacterium]